MKEHELRSGVNSKGALKQKGLKQTSLKKGLDVQWQLNVPPDIALRDSALNTFVFRMNLQINSGYMYMVFFLVSTSCGNYLFRCLFRTYCPRLWSDWIRFMWIMEWVGRNMFVGCMGVFEKIWPIWFLDGGEG